MEKIIPNLNEHQKDVKDRSVFRYGNPHYKDSLISQSYPQYLIDLTNYLINNDILKKKPISITINRYKVGDYISAHIDARKHDDIVTILNLENNCDFFLQKGSKIIKIDFEKNMIIQLKDEFRWDWTHYVNPVKYPRTSIVFR